MSIGVLLPSSKQKVILEGDSELVTAITTLSETVIKAGEISTDQNNQILEFLVVLSQETAALREKRRLAIMRSLPAELS